MPATFDSLRLRQLAATDNRYKAEIGAQARNIGTLIQRAATGRVAPGAPALVPNTQAARIELKTAIWASVIKPYFIGPGNDPFAGPAPMSPFARLLTEGIEAAIRIQARRQIAILRRVVKDPVVLAWLTGPRPIGPVRELNAQYDPFHQFVDPNGYRLSDRVWQDSINVRSRIDAFLDYEIGRGTSAVEMAKRLEIFLTPGAAGQKTSTPYGTEGSYAARRLARTEVTAAAGRATVNLSQANPYVTGVRWVTSLSHRELDQCDENASGGVNGDGVYPPGSAPLYPNHPHCLCNLQPVTGGAAGDADFTAKMRADIDKAAGGLPTSERAKVLKGMFGEDFMTRGLMDGSYQQAMQLIRPIDTIRRPLPPVIRPLPPVRPKRPRKPRVAPPVPLVEVPPPPPVAPPPAKPYDVSEGTRIREALTSKLDAFDLRDAELQRQIDAITDKLIYTDTDMRRLNSARNAAAQEAMLEKRRLRNKDLIDERQRLYTERIELRLKIEKAALKALELPTDRQSDVSLVVKSAQFRDRPNLTEFRERKDKAIDFVNSVTANASGDIKVERNTTGREFAQPGMVSVDTGTSTGVIVHEIGHNIEYTRGADFRAKRIAFFNDRTAGDTPERFIDVYPTAGFEPHETFKRDKWLDTYMGKEYKHDSDQRGSSELISMGIQMLFEDPNKLIKRDPGYFDFIVSYLRGSL